MSRINQAFANKANIAYLTAGDGGLKLSVEYFLALAAGGASLLEVGIPYSDPIADGPVIQQAMQRALAQKTNVEVSLEIVRQIRSQSEVGIILFTYYNPIQADLGRFLASAKSAGADGVLIVDLPFEESQNYLHFCRYLELEPVTIIAPSTTQERMKKVLTNLANGFIYYVCQKGTTGARSELPDDLAEQIAKIRSVSQLPVAIGFGVANSEMVKKIQNIADGCIVGSYLVRAVADRVTPQQLSQLTRELFDVN